MEPYEKLSDKIEMNFRDIYEDFIVEFINSIKDGLNEALKGFIKEDKKDNKNQEGEESGYECKKVKQDYLWGGVKRFFRYVFNDKWGYDEKGSHKKITTIKAGAVVDYLTEMHDNCQKALNDSVGSFKIGFKEKLYDKVFSQLCKIVPNKEKIDEVAFKKKRACCLGSH